MLVNMESIHSVALVFLLPLKNVAQRAARGKVRLQGAAGALWQRRRQRPRRGGIGGGAGWTETPAAPPPARPTRCRLPLSPFSCPDPPLPQPGVPGLFSRLFNPPTASRQRLKRPPAETPVRQNSDTGKTRPIAPRRLRTASM